MTATEELRRMLDERGVEWWQSVNMLGCVFTRWYSPLFSDEVVAMENGDGELELFSHLMTPEQAIEATLGRGTCRFIDEDNYNETEGCDSYSWFRCSACGWTFDECDRWLTTMSYCPSCGRKVVEE